jgi:hypothetical protein
VPKEIYYVPAWAATYTNNNIYNSFWKQFIDEITDKDSSLVTGWFHLTPADIAMLDFRHVYRFGFQNYRLNRIYDYNPVQDGLTKCEFIKTKTAIPFVPSSVLLVGGRDSMFDGGELGPSLTAAQVVLDELQAGARPYKVYSALLTQQSITEGPLEIGVEYRIVAYSSGDDFLNVGALVNATGEVFVATGTIPTTYSNFSTLTTNKFPDVIVLENTIGPITWSYITQSLYAANLIGAFPEDKTWIILSKTSNTNQFAFWGSIDQIFVQTSIAVIGPTNNPSDPISWFGTDGELFANSIEIRVYN